MAQEEELVFDGCVIHCESLLPEAAMDVHPGCFYRHYRQHPGLHASSNRHPHTFKCFQIQLLGTSHVPLFSGKYIMKTKIQIFSFFVSPLLRILVLLSRFVLAVIFLSSSFFPLQTLIKFAA
jgi:hypothetical protein